MAERRDLVSIIVPVYNVERYVSRCIDSLRRQTYKNIEIIVIDDGSTDNTGAICDELCKEDDRIIYIKREHEGQGSARNCGIESAKGNYVTFADADDWCALEYVEKMYASMVKYDTDICVCGKYGVKLDETGNIISKKAIEQWMQPEMRIETAANKNLIYQIKFSLWSKMFRRELFTKHNIIQPSHKFENNTIIPMLVSKADFMSMVDEPLYYYWMNRESSTINSLHSYVDMIKCLNRVNAYFKQEGNWDEYADSLYLFSKWNIVHTLNRISQIQRVQKQEDRGFYKKIEKEFQDFMESTFSDRDILLDRKATVWGSYNLKRTVKGVLPGERIINTFSYSSIVSAVHEGTEGINRETHENGYREKMIRQDISKVFACDKSIWKETDLLFVDLLEERFHVCDIEGNLYTKSDVFDEVIKDKVVEIEWDEEYWEMWKQSCKKFIDLILEQTQANQIVLVTYKLSECFGRFNHREAFPNGREIKDTNIWLDKAYQFFEENCKGCIVIKIQENDFFFSDEEFEYDCEPCYLNYMLFDQAVQEINRRVGRR